jgi:hypothetical protein
MDKHATKGMAVNPVIDSQITAVIKCVGDIRGMIYNIRQD